MLRCFIPSRVTVFARAGPTVVVGLLGLVLPRDAWAHGEASVTPETVWSAWNAELFPVLALVFAAGAYAWGLTRLWRRAGVGQGVRRWQGVAFGGGLVALAVALVSPLEALAGTLFSAHMVQHLLLILGAAPLLVLGAPCYVGLWVLPKSWRRAVARWGKQPPLRAGWHVLSHPFLVWFLYAAVMWGWHAPALFGAALHSDWIHEIEHFSFLLAAMLFCWILINPMGRRRITRGVGILYLFTTSAHGSLLGVLITFAPRPWYAHYAESTQAWGLTPLQDQQLAGLIMWIPVGMIYAGLAALLFVLWMRDVEGSVRMSERRSAAAHRSVAYPHDGDPS